MSTVQHIALLQHGYKNLTRAARTAYDGDTARVLYHEAAKLLARLRRLRAIHGAGEKARRNKIGAVFVPVGGASSCVGDRAPPPSSREGRAHG